MRYCGVWCCDRLAVVRVPVTTRRDDGYPQPGELEVCDRHARGLPRPCVNCQYRPATRSTHRCDTCNTYWYKYGRDRDEQTIVKHNRRRFERGQV